MAGIDRSIFRQRAIDKYVQRRELHVILRLVSPPMFVFLWVLLLLTVCAGVLVWSIQQPILVQGKGVVVQQKMNNTQRVIVLLLLPPDQQANLKVGQPVSVTIASTGMTFKSSIETVEDGVMSPAAISTQVNLQLPLAPTIAGPSIVAIAPVQPTSQASTYVGSQCQVQVQIGSQSALSLLPGFNNVPQILNNFHIPAIFNGVAQNFNKIFKR